MGYCFSLYWLCLYENGLVFFKNEGGRSGGGKDEEEWMVVSLIGGCRTRSYKTKKFVVGRYCKIL